MSAFSAAGGELVPASQSFADFVVTPTTGATVHFGSFLPLIASIAAVTPPPPMIDGKNAAVTLALPLST